MVGIITRTRAWRNSHSLVGPSRTAIWLAVIRHLDIGAGLKVAEPVSHLQRRAHIRPDRRCAARVRLAQTASTQRQYASHQAAGAPPLVALGRDDFALQRQLSRNVGLFPYARDGACAAARTVGKRHVRPVARGRPSCAVLGHACGVCKSQKLWRGTVPAHCALQLHQRRDAAPSGAAPSGKDALLRHGVSDRARSWQGAWIPRPYYRHRPGCAGEVDFGNGQHHVSHRKARGRRGLRVQASAAYQDTRGARLVETQLRFTGDNEEHQVAGVSAAGYSQQHRGHEGGVQQACH